MTTINTNLSVTAIQDSIAPLPASTSPNEFRNVALGDINLLYETAMSSKMQNIKVFVARISGEPSVMTVAKYEDETEVSLDLSRVKYIDSTAPVEMAK